MLQTLDNCCCWSLLLLIAGCGFGARSDGRVAAAGAITLDGTAVTGGRITFTPQNGNVGPAAGGTIDSAGRYEIPAAEGPGTGAYTVRIVLNPTAVGDKFQLRAKTDNQPFTQSTTIASDNSSELHFNLTSPPAPPDRPQ